MQLDWFTFAAQIVNFLLLIWLLHRLLYRRLVTAMEEREDRIASQFHLAEERQAEAARAESSFHAREQELESQRAERMSRSEEDAEAKSQQMLREARSGIEALERSWRQELTRQRETFLAELRRQTARAVLDLCRRALSDLADARLEAQALARFRRLLDDSEGEERQAIAKALASAEPAVLHTAFELSESDRQQLAEALGRLTEGPVPPLTVAVEPERGFGIELETGGWRVGWSLDGYLESLGERVGELLDAGYAPAEVPRPVTGVPVTGVPADEVAP